MTGQQRRRFLLSPGSAGLALVLACVSPPAARGQVGFLSDGGGDAFVQRGHLGGSGVSLLGRGARASWFPSWFAWADTRHAGFVADRWPGGLPPEPDAAWGEARDAAAAELMAALWRVRGADEAAEDAERLEAALVLALGRIGGSEAEALLLGDDGPIASPSGPVRGMTRLALGLLGSEAAAARLRADLAGGDPAAAAGAAAGMTLLPLLDEAGQRALLEAVRSGPGDDTRRLALRALAVQGSALNPRLMPAVLREVPRVFLAEQALLAAPDFASPDDQNLLRRFLRVGGRFDDFPVGVEVRLLGPALLGGAERAGFRGSPTISRQVDVGEALAPAAPAPDRASPPRASGTGGDGNGGGGGGNPGEASGGSDSGDADDGAGPGRRRLPGARGRLGIGGTRIARSASPTRSSSGWRPRRRWGWRGCGRPIKASWRTPSRSWSSSSGRDRRRGPIPRGRRCS